jgi:ribonuclease D
VPAAPQQHGPPAYLDSADDVARFVDTIAGTRALAVDTEGASFHRFIDRVYLLQLTARTPDGDVRSAIVDPLPITATDLADLGAIAEDRAVEVIFHDADYDLRLLHQDYGWRVTNIFDTRIAAQLVGLKAFGLAALLEKYFGVKLDKKHQRADWSMRPLTDGMLDYAAQDTRYLLDLRDELKRELERLGRWDWAKEEFERLEGTQFAEDAGDGAFLRLKGARDLNRRELALLRELVQWRDSVAEGLDRATFRVAGNEVLLEMAKQAPQTKEALLAIKGAPRGMVESRGAEMLAAVRRGLAVPEAELPRFPKSPRWDRDPDFDEKVSRVKAVRDGAAARLDLDPGVLCSRERLETIVRRAPQSVEDLAEVKDLRRWQVELMGEEFVEALRSMPVTTTPAAPEGEGETSAAPPGSNGGRSGRRGRRPTRSGSPQRPATSSEAEESPYKDG